jgi:hypothetical protein
MTKFRKGQKVIVKLGWTIDSFKDCGGNRAFTDEEFEQLPKQATAEIIRREKEKYHVKFLDAPGGHGLISETQISEVGMSLAREEEKKKARLQRAKK